MSWLKRRHDVLNNTIQILKTELYLNDIVLSSELGQRISSVYDRTLMAAELYKERLEALTQSSRSQVWRVQTGQNVVVPTPVPLMSLDLNNIKYNSTLDCDSWAPKRRKPNHAEEYTHNTITNNHQQRTNNRNKKKKNKPKGTVLPAPKTVAAIPKTISSVPKTATISAVKAAIKPTAEPKPTAFATLITAAKTTTSTVNTTAFAAKTVASVTNTTISAAKKKASTIVKGPPATKATPTTKATPETKAKAKTKGRPITKASPSVAQVRASAIKPTVSAVVATEQARKQDIVTNFIPKGVPIGQRQISGASAVNQPVQVKRELNGDEIIQNTLSFFSVDMSHVKLQFAASDRITFKSESNPLNWAGNINSTVNVIPAHVNEEDMMIDDLADHL